MLFKNQVPFTATALTSADTASRSRNRLCVVVKIQGLNPQSSKELLLEAVHWTQGSAGRIVVTSLLGSNPGIIVCGAVRYCASGQQTSGVH
jgi:hypothetical protein